MRAFVWFLFAAVYAVLAQQVAAHAARGLAGPEWYELVSRCMLLFLLLVGYAGMGRIAQRQTAPMQAMGLTRRAGWRQEAGLGLVLGWGGIVASVLPLALFGSLLVRVDASAHQWFVFASDLIVLAVAALAEEIAFRGYPFQRLIEAVGPGLATLLMSLIFAGAHLLNPDASTASLCSTMLAGLVLSVAYLRTRALWVSWGFHFGWNASMGLLFGLPVSGLTSFSPVVSSYTRGPVWLTGGGYGPEGGAVGIVVLFVVLVLLFPATRELKHRYATPVIVPGGIPVDIDALSRHQHEQGMGPGANLAPPPAGHQLVQILVPAPAPEATAERDERDLQ